MNDIEILAYHGWGFNADCWHKWKQNIPNNATWKSFDRGYFGDHRTPVFEDSVHTKMVITHSFGLHLCPDEIFEQADVLVIFAGFLQFHPKAAQFRRRSTQVLNEMIKQFDESPQNVLKTFYRNVFHPEKEFRLPPDQMNESSLLRDLKKLGNAKRTLPNVKKSAKVFIFHGTDDAIVPKRKGRALYEKFGKQAQYFEIKNGGHALPMTHPQKCWQMIEPEITESIK